MSSTRHEVRAIVRYALCIWNDTLGRWTFGGGNASPAWDAAKDGEYGGPGPIMEHVGALTCCDGAPAGTISRLKEQSDEYKNIANAHGGFHGILEVRAPRSRMTLLKTPDDGGALSPGSQGDWQAVYIQPLAYLCLGMAPDGWKRKFYPREHRRSHTGVL